MLPKLPIFYIREMIQKNHISYCVKPVSSIFKIKSNNWKQLETFDFVLHYLNRT